MIITQQDIWVLHCGDFHFGHCCFAESSNDPEHIACRHLSSLVDALNLKEGFNLKDLDAVVLGGDFTWTEGSFGFDIAEHFIRMLRVQLRPDTPILLVVGNHDVHLEAPTPLGKILLPPDYDAQQRPFRDFVRRIGSAVVPVCEDGSCHVRIAKPGLGEMILVALNSTRTECRDAQGVGWVGLDQIASCMRRLLAESGPEGAMMISALHHHVVPVGNLPLEILRRPIHDRKFSFMLDSWDLTEWLPRFGFCAVLHGHTHRSFYRWLTGFSPYLAGVY